MKCYRTQKLIFKFIVRVDTLRKHLLYTDCLKIRFELKMILKKPDKFFPVFNLIV